MYVTWVWIALLFAVVIVELWSRKHPERFSSLSRTGALLASRLPGRVVLVVLWVFVGLHLFARYTIPKG